MTSETGFSVLDVVEETSPDLLKNTPSNIQRLAHEIEQCEGRKKYLAQTGSPADGGDVRWYFCKVPLGVNELAASVPRTEIVGKGDYFRFGMRDSLAIEASFLQREDDLLSSWWKEFAECSEGPKGQPSNISELNLPISSQGPKLWQLFTDEEERVGVPVKGGLYEVDLVKRHCFPVYWNGENRRVLRGHWFARKGGLDWLPLREDVSEQLEYAYRGKVWHRRTFQPSGLFAARVDLQGSSKGLHALFTGEDDTWEAWLSVENSGFSGVVGFARNSIKLRRGYAPPQSQNPTQDELRQQKEEEMDDYCSQVPVRHVVFMVHGIGQRLEKSNLVDDVGEFRHVTASLEERHLTSYQRGMQRILYIPCQWRKGLTLSGETAIEKITLDGVRGLRRTLSATVHDVLYYMSPIYCQEIIDSVSNQLNRLYLKFLKRNPGYNGKVSLYGHSLGSVLSYDILCHQETLYSPFPMEWMYKEHKRAEASSSAESNLSSIPNSFPNREHENSENIGVGDLVTRADNSDLVEEHIGVGDLVTRADNSDLVEEHIGVGDLVTHADNPDLVEQHMESYQLGPPTPSESDESMIIDTGCQQTNDALLSDENHDEVSSNSNDVEVSNGDFISGTSSQGTGIPCDEQKHRTDTTGDDKDEIIKSLREEIDMLREKIKESEAECANKVSLSSTMQRDQPGSTADQPGLEDSFKSYTPQMRYTKLLFKVDTFFAVGSPLGVFLAMRNVRIGIGKGKEYWDEENINEEMPACRQMFNIFHPCDPVAYRIEPLVCKEFIHKRPLTVPYHRGGKRLYVGFQELREGVATRSQAFKNQLTTVRVKVLTICESKSSDGQPDESENTKEEVERSYGTYMVERLSGSVDGRVDYTLQDKTFRHPYVSVLSAHTNYWRDPDTALFILKHLYRDIPDEPSSLSDEGCHSEERWSDPREIDDEELPLTFTDTVSFKNFLLRAKRQMKNP